MPTRVRGISSPIYSIEEMTVARLAYNGEIIEGWVKAPTGGKSWEPQGGDLLWLPPSATKSTDIDGIGRVVEVGPWTPGEDMAWIQAQLDKRDRYLELVRDKVRAGALRLTAALAKMLGLNFGDGAELTPISLPAHRSGVVGAYKAASDLRRAIGLPVDPDTGLAIVSTADRNSRIKALADAAAQRFAETGSLEAALAELRAGMDRTRPGKVA